MASGGRQRRVARATLIFGLTILLGSVLPASAVLQGSVSTPDPVATVLADPFVSAALSSPAFAAIQAAHANDEGLLAVVPLPAPASHVGILYSGAAPADVESGYERGLPVQLYEHQEPEVLVEPVDPAILASLAEEDDHWNKPLAPGPAQGIGPGSHMLIGRPDGTVRCTANFVFRDAEGNLYLGTAGHCVLAGVEESTDPAFRQPMVRVCTDNCLDATLATGTFQRIGLVLYAISDGVGRDFGFVFIPPELHHRVRPWVWHFGGPAGQTAGAGAAGTGVPLLHYGNGVGVGETFATQGRAAISLGGSGGDYTGFGWATGGDSGSGVVTAGPQGTTNVGNLAVGDLTHSIVTVGAPLFFGTTVNRGILFAEAATGKDLSLVVQGGF